MDPRRTGLSVLITIGIMLALGVVGAVHRGGGHSKSGGLHGAPPNGSSAVHNNQPIANPLHSPPVAEWDVLSGCELAENKTDAAHHFHVRRGDDTYVFQLYFTNAPEVTTARPEQASEQARYFCIAANLAEHNWNKVLAGVGEEAWRYARDLLQQRPFHVFTKWEKRPETHHYYALVLVRDERGQKRFLQELLAARGYAILSEPPLKSLPDGTAGPDFLEQLVNLQHQAQQKHVGGWARLRNLR